MCESLAKVDPENTALRCNGVFLFSKDNIVHTHFSQPIRDARHVIFIYI